MTKLKNVHINLNMYQMCISSPSCTWQQVYILFHEWVCIRNVHTTISEISQYTLQRQSISIVL